MQAVELDVYVVPLPAGGSDGTLDGHGDVPPSAWALATQEPASSREGKDPEPTGAGSDGGAASRRRKEAAARLKAEAKGGVEGGGAERSASPEPLGLDAEDSSAAGGVGEGSADEAGYASEEMATHVEVGPRDGSVVTRQRPLQIRVGEKPLIVRAAAALDSDLIGQLVPGSMVTVVEERIDPDGNVRACVLYDTDALPPSPRARDDDSTSELLLPDVADPDAVGMQPGATALKSPKSPKSPKTPNTPKTPKTPKSSSAIYPPVLSAPNSGSGGGESAHPPSGLFSGPSSYSAPAPPLIVLTSSPRLLTGWVTLKKEGRKLVTSRVRLASSTRRDHVQQWGRRQLNDKLKYNVTTELAGDPTGVAFAYGGVHPGHLYSRGRLYETHHVSYSIGKVGRYLLHVRLRGDARPLPGSPFALVVKPGAAHAMNTTVSWPDGGLRGVVGLGPSDGCTLTMQASDQMGNPCATGGEKVENQCTQPGVTKDVVDNHDGTYTLHWRSKESITFKANILINGSPVRGCPVRMTIMSGQPELSKTEIDSETIRNSVAGETSTLYVKFYDAYENPTAPDNNFVIAVANSIEKKKLSDALKTEHNIVWGDSGSGACELSFIPRVAGSQELHVWGDPHNTGERQPFPGSPYPVLVKPGLPTATASYIDGWSKEQKGTQEHHGPGANKAKTAKAADDVVVAGDVVLVRPSIFDSFGNLTALPAGAMVAEAHAPDGTITPLTINHQTRTRARDGDQEIYDVKQEVTLSGSHNFQLFLDGVPIKGSPIYFDVHPAAPEPSMCKIVNPTDIQNLTAGEHTYERPTIVPIKTFDKYGNACITGGLLISARLQLVKQGANDLTILMPNNHNVAIEDYNNGEYGVNISIKVAATVKLFVNLDKNLPGQQGEMVGMQLTFVALPADASEAPAMVDEPEPPKKTPSRRKVSSETVDSEPSSPV